MKIKEYRDGLGLRAQACLAMQYILVDPALHGFLTELFWRACHF